MGIESYNPSASLNTLLGSINTAEGMARSDVDEAIRQIMADLGGGVAPAISPKRFGAVGDGTTDDRTAVLACCAYAFANGIPVDGRGDTFAVSGNLRFDSYTNPRLRNIEFKQLAPNGTVNGIPSSDRRTLFFSACNRVRLENVRVNRGTDGTSGSLGSAAGIYIQSGSGHFITNVEVYGNGQGSGVFFDGISTSTVVNAVGHDIAYDSTSATNDMVQGVFVANCTDCTFIGLKGYNLSGNATGMPASRYTRGIALGGNTRCSFVSPFARSVDQGMDVTGDLGNTFCTISGFLFKDCASWGLKIANSGYMITVDGGIGIDCGLSAVVVSGPATAGLIYKGEFITVSNVKAYNTGSNGASWGAHIGFRIMTGAFDTAYPRNISFIGCEAIDLQGTPTMTTGFSSDVVNDPANPNQIADCKSKGHTVAMSSGVYRVGKDFPFVQFAAAPSSPTEGQSYYDTVTHKARTWDGTAWNNHW